MADFDAVLWDFGGVFSPSPFSTLERLGRARGHDPRAFLEAIFGPCDVDGDHPWHRLERGEIDFGRAREEIPALGRAGGRETDPLDLFVDDHAANVAAAEALGMRGVLVPDDYAGALREIEALLG